ncbi:hypothetical protein GMST_11900 [Geomonas silvestris]|uniref:Peptidase C51 domain-containing protein n=1 Tax=Geomonas silvestris TaxID=2740184 RepID=A0A6V8MFW6_9BACT|nr:CHAP domain-containing protein [Geomonas silvestris]GFO58865.1 hypothetical protein GMST_11900 [Geomonas silvestris]
MRYPGRIIRKGEKDAQLVRAIKTKLNEALGFMDQPELMLDPKDGNFGPKMESAIRFYQSRHVDAEGMLLRQDGELGPNTWGALFGDDTVNASTTPRDPLLAKVLQVAADEEAKKVREKPKNSNRGPEVDRYVASTGAPMGSSWCCAFVYWCFEQGAKAMGRTNPMVRTAGCLNHWEEARKKGTRSITADAAQENPALVESGMVFIMDHGSGMGHTGLVEKVTGGVVTTIEGNTDASKTREGGGVYRLVRKIGDINKGFIDYTG